MEMGRTCGQDGLGEMGIHHDIDRTRNLEKL
jgi:hypothetical protein